MGKSHYDMAHDFYYLGVDTGKSTRFQKPRVTYDGCDAFSYSTLVAKVIQRRGAKTPPTTSDTSSALTLVSFDTMTSSTSKHLSCLMSASPFNTVSVPMKYGDSTLYPNKLSDGFIAELERYSKGLSRRENRDRFLMLWHSRETLLNEACEEWAKPLRIAKFGKYAKIAADMAGYAKKLAEENRAKAAKQAAKTRSVLKKIGAFRGAEYLEAVRQIFQPWSVNLNSKWGKLSEKAKEILKKKLHATGNAYVWRETRTVDDGKVENLVVTSKYVKIPEDEVRVALKAWALGHDMRTFKVGYYTIVKYEGDVIQIGCHKIPRENVLALYEAIMGRPFEMRKVAA